jgi:molecular chaperone DnaJ
MRPAADAFDMTDFYQTLGISKQASQSEIRTVFRRLARQYHPDRNPDDETAEAMFVEINEAHATLADPAKRKRYDELLRLGAFERRARGGFRSGQGGVQEFDPRLYQRGSRTFQMGNFADFLSNLGDAPGGAQVDSRRS